MTSKSHNKSLQRAAFEMLRQGIRRQGMVERAIKSPRTPAGLVREGRR
jgi:hypothetical protein